VTAPAVLWGSNGAASFAVHAVLEQTGHPYEARWLDLAPPDAPRPAELLALSAEGRVPVLQLDGQVLTESAAICLHLADLHPEAGLVPAPGTAERAQLLRRLVFLTNTVQEAMLRFLYPHRYVDDPTAGPAVKRRAEERLHELFDRLEDALGGAYVVGDAPTVADVYLFMLVRWGRHLSPPAWSRPRLRDHWLRVLQLPGVARAVETEGLDERPPR